MGGVGPARRLLKVNTGGVIRRLHYYPRTCGGGVMTEERQCGGSKPDECAGPSKRFSSCNLDECPRGSRDFREEQCAKFNNELFERKYYDWIPYLKAPRKCELNCMPKGERFYYRHAKKVCA